MRISYWNKSRGKWRDYKNPRLMELLAEMRRHDLAEAKAKRKREETQPELFDDGPDANGWCESYWR